MSSRSFRRRNNRRRHRAAGGGLGAAGGGLPENAASGSGAEAGEVQGHSDARQGGARDGVIRPGQGGPGAREGTPGPGFQKGGGRQERQQGGRQRSRGRGSGANSPQQARGPGQQEPQVPARTAVPLVLPDCPLCGKQVRELPSAVTHRVSRQPAHFDCVINEIRDSNEVAPQEKICYLGGGSFGILEFRPSGGATRFVIRKRIQYEEKETPQEWKKPLQVLC